MPSRLEEPSRKQIDLRPLLQSDLNGWMAFTWHPPLAGRVEHLTVDPRPVRRKDLEDQNRHPGNHQRVRPPGVPMGRVGLPDRLGQERPSLRADPAPVQRTPCTGLVGPQAAFQRLECPVHSPYPGNPQAFWRVSGGLAIPATSRRRRSSVSRTPSRAPTRGFSRATRSCQLHMADR